MSRLYDLCAGPFQSQSGSKAPCKGHRQSIHKERALSTTVTTKFMCTFASRVLLLDKPDQSFRRVCAINSLDSCCCLPCALESVGRLATVKTANKLIETIARVVIVKPAHHCNIAVVDEVLCVRDSIANSANN